MLYPTELYQATWVDSQLWVRGMPDDSEIYEYEYIKIIYVNCGWNMSEIWSSQYAEKKFRQAFKLFFQLRW